MSVTMEQLLQLIEQQQQQLAQQQQQQQHQQQQQQVFVRKRALSFVVSIHAEPSREAHG